MFTSLCITTLYALLLTNACAHILAHGHDHDHDHDHSFSSSEEWPMRHPPPQPRRPMKRQPHPQREEPNSDFMFPNPNDVITFPKSRPDGRERDRGGGRGRGQGGPQPNQRGKRNQRICERKYAEYVERIFPNEADTIEDANDTDFDGRELAAPGEYPHMVAVGFKEERSSEIDYKCGGSLISERFVVTAAHCTNITGETPSKVRIGDLNLTLQETKFQTQTRSISRIYNQPNYNTSSYYNDIALLQLDSDVTFTEFVRPIRLWVRDVFPYSIAYAMGYGSTSFGKARTNRLTDLNMTIVPNDECNGLMPEMPEAKMGIIESQICALDYKYKRDTCQGDSGGPLQLNLRGRRDARRKHYHLIGITSYGLYCRSGHPSVYTRISAYIDWIERVVWPSER